MHSPPCAENRRKKSTAMTARRVPPTDAMSRIKKQDKKLPTIVMQFSDRSGKRTRRNDTALA
jgi:hypothetical protein